MIKATRHDMMAEGDYRLLASHGIRTVRDGMRWHLIERLPGHYDFSSLLSQLRGARAAGTEVIWDVLHYGWPDNLDIFSPAFVDRFAAFSAAAARVVREESELVPFYVPVNEISFLAWAAGDVAIFYPFKRGRGEELKRQLVRASLASMRAIRDVDPRARFVLVDPAIRVLPNPERPDEAHLARHHNDSQFDAWDMIAGRRCPELGGAEQWLDIIGINYYCHNQWHHRSGPIPWDGSDPAYTPLSDLLVENHARFKRPILIAETGIEAELRPTWFRSVCTEAMQAIARGATVEGICLYPIMNHPGWDDERHCPNGMVDYSRETFERFVYPPLAEELARQRGALTAMEQRLNNSRVHA